MLQRHRDFLHASKLYCPRAKGIKFEKFYRIGRLIEEMTAREERSLGQQLKGSNPSLKIRTLGECDCP